MKYDYLMIYNDFFLKKISYDDFKNQLMSFMNSSSIGQLKDFFDYITDDSFSAYDADMVMLSYLTLWFLENPVRKTFALSGADNMYCSFIKSVLDSYPYVTKLKETIIQDNFNYAIFQFQNLYLIINKTEMDLTIPLPIELKDKACFCVNCGEEVTTDEDLPIYPYGFYFLEVLS